MDNALKEIAAQIDSKEEVVEEVVEEAIETNEVVEEETSSDDDIKTISQLAQAIEVEPEYLYSMEIGMGDNKEAIPLGKLKDEYQNTIRERDTLKAQLEQQQAQLTQAQAGITQHEQVSQAQQVAQSEVMSVQTQYNQIDWRAFEQDDAGGAALARQKFQEAFNAAQQGVQQAQMYSQQERQKVIHYSAAKLLEVIPEWNDSTVRDTGTAKVRDALLKAGYTADMIAGASDYRAIALMNELIGYRERDAQSKEVMQKVKSAPKVLKGRGQQLTTGRKTAELVNKAKQSGNKHDELAAVKSLLKL